MTILGNQLAAGTYSDPTHPLTNPSLGGNYSTLNFSFSPFVEGIEIILI